MSCIAVMVVTKSVRTDNCDREILLFYVTTSPSLPTYLPTYMLCTHIHNTFTYHGNMWLKNSQSAINTFWYKKLYRSWFLSIVDSDGNICVWWSLIHVQPLPYFVAICVIILILTLGLRHSVKCDFAIVVWYEDRCCIIWRKVSKLIIWEGSWMFMLCSLFLSCSLSL